MSVQFCTHAMQATAGKARQGVARQRKKRVSHRYEYDMMGWGSSLTGLVLVLG